jgi:DNA-directed RNA polymerase specialized sigma24 family protein
MAVRFGDRLIGVVHRSLRRCGASAGPDEVAELVQDVWCRALERCRNRLPGIVRRGGEEQAFAYLACVARNLVVDRLRHQGAAKRGGTAQRRLARDDEQDPLARVPDDGPSAEERLLAWEARRLFLARCRPYVSRSRPRRDLAIVERALIDGWTSPQIAAELEGSVTASGIDSLLHRVRRGLAREGLVVASRGRPGRYRG